MSVAKPHAHGHGFVYIPANRILSVFNSPEDVRQAVRDLDAMGYDDEYVDVFTGPEGADTLDLTGEKHGVMARVVFNLEALLLRDDAHAFREADAALRAGGVVVAVRMDGSETYKGNVADVLRSHNGKQIRYFTRWMVESLD